MTDPHATDETSPRPGVDRRTLLAAAGATGLFGAVGQAAGTQSDGGTAAGDGDAVHPRFGYTGTSPEERPPVDPDHTVQLEIRPREGAPIPEFYFRPTGLAVEPGDTVRFASVTTHHTVTAYHPGFGNERRVPEGVPPFTSPVLVEGDYWLYTFEREGVYDVNCAPHEAFGMVARIVVGTGDATGQRTATGNETATRDRQSEGTQDAATPPSDGTAAEARPPLFTAALVLGDEALTPEAIRQSGTVGWDDIAAENKRLLIQPTEGNAPDGADGTPTPE